MRRGGGGWVGGGAKGPLFWACILRVGGRRSFMDTRFTTASTSNGPMYWRPSCIRSPPDASRLNSQNFCNNFPEGQSLGTWIISQASMIFFSTSHRSVHTMRCQVGWTWSWKCLLQGHGVWREHLVSGSYNFCDRSRQRWIVLRDEPTVPVGSSTSWQNSCWIDSCDLCILSIGP